MSYTEEQVGRMLTPSEGVPVVYANNASFRVSYWDLTLDFGIVENLVEGELLVRNQVRVVMSPQHARVLSQLLATHIAAYERQFGPLPIPPDAEQPQAEPGA